MQQGPLRKPHRSLQVLTVFDGNENELRLRWMQLYACFGLTERRQAEVGGSERSLPEEAPNPLGFVPLRTAHFD